MYYLKSQALALVCEKERLVPHGWYLLEYLFLFFIRGPQKLGSLVIDVGARRHGQNTTIDDDAIYFSRELHWIEVKNGRQKGKLFWIECPNNIQ